MAKTTLTKQVNEMIYQNFYGYVNGIIDDNYELLTRSEWVEYIIEGLRRDAEHGQIVNGLEFKHLYFYGKDQIVKAINKFLDQETGANEFIKQED